MPNQEGKISRVGAHHARRRRRADGRGLAPSPSSASSRPEAAREVVRAPAEDAAPTTRGGSKWDQDTNASSEPIRRRATYGSATAKKPPPSFNDDDDSAATVYRNLSGGMINCNTVGNDRDPTRGSRRATVSFAPLPFVRAPPSPSRDGDNRNDADPGCSAVGGRKKGRGFRRDYSIGEAVRHPSHMAFHATPEQTFQSINALQNRDFAFVKRPDGSFAYAILACRSLEPPADHSMKSSETLEECMVFATCDAGSTLKVRKDEWTEYVRTVSSEGLKRRTRGLGNSGTSEKGEEEDWIPPNIISFVQTKEQRMSEITLPSLSSASDK